MTNTRSFISYFLFGVNLFATTAFADSDFLGAIVAKKIALSRHACILATNGTVKCWGENSQGQLGVGSTLFHGAAENTMGNSLPLVDLGPDVTAKDICVGNAYSCAVTTKGGVKCWGNNNLGALGHGRTNSGIGTKPADMGEMLPLTNLGDDFAAKSIECASDFVCALSETGKVKCWGDGRNGGLGRTLQNQTSVGLKTSEMGNALPYIPIATPITQLSLGTAHACAVSDNKIYCWGSNQNGELGLEASTSIVVFPAAPTKMATVQLEISDLPIKIESVQAGSAFTCATYFIPPGDSSFVPRRFKCWGLNTSGQLGNGTTTSFGRNTGSMGAALPTVNADLSDVTEFHPYGSHTCAKNSDGTLKCWGRNTSGQLGLGDTVARGTSSQGIGSSLPFVNLDLPVLSLSVGPIAQATCAILINHEVKCWGNGSNGILGYEDMRSRGALPADLGEKLPYVRFY